MNNVGVVQRFDGDDLLYSGDGGDAPYGGIGGDRCYGLSGRDAYVGWLWNDTLDPHQHVAAVKIHLGNYVLSENCDRASLSGFRSFIGTTFGDQIYLGNHLAGTVYGRSGNDRIYSDLCNDVVHGKSGSDYLQSGHGDDRLFGGFRDDKVNGKNGDYELHGGSGFDRIYGGSCDDIISGGAGIALLHGGTGADTFKMEGAFGVEKILDFMPGFDQIKFNGAGFEGRDFLIFKNFDGLCGSHQLTLRAKETLSC